MSKLVMWNATQYPNFSEALESGAVYNVQGCDLGEALSNGGHLSALWDLEQSFDSFCELMNHRKGDLVIGMQAEVNGFQMFLPLGELLAQQERAMQLENERLSTQVSKF